MVSPLTTTTDSHPERLVVFFGTLYTCLNNLKVLPNSLKRVKKIP